MADTPAPSDDVSPPATVSDLIQHLLEVSGATANRDVLRDILRSAAGLATDDVDRLDLKITAAALREMRRAFGMFRPLAGIPKVTVFGSARTQAQDPLYDQARRLANHMATAGWMVITGAGPGIMAAAAEGAGRAQSIGVSIQLPFEEAPSDVIADDDKLVAMKYFFTRKLMLIKESSAFVCLPGGFGTQDETFELLTLLQTGKATPTAVVLLDIPGGSYWKDWQAYLDAELVAPGLISAEDHELYLITDDVDEAVAEVQRFWSNYHSIRWVGDRLVVRLHRAPSPSDIVQLTTTFGDLLLTGSITAGPPLPPEVSDRDNLDLARVVMHYDPRKAGRLRALIDALNDLPSARG